MRGKHLVGALALVAVLLALGSTVRDRSAQAAVQRAARATLDAGSSRVSVRTEFADPSLPHGAAAHVTEGVIDYRAHRGALFSVSKGRREAYLVFDGETTYVNFAGFAKHFGLEKTWLKFEGATADAFDPQERALRDPATLLVFLRAASRDVRSVGTERLDGVETVHYTGTLDLALVAESLEADEREAAMLEVEFLRDEGEPTTVPYDVWVDGSDVTRRLRLVNGTPPSTWTRTVDFSDFGIEVDVPLPAAADVFGEGELEAVMRAHGSQTGDCETQTSETGEVVARICSQMFFIGMDDDKGGGK